MLCAALIGRKERQDIKDIKVSVRVSAWNFRIESKCKSARYLGAITPK